MTSEQGRRQSKGEHPANIHLSDFCCRHLKLPASAQRANRVPREDVVCPSSSGEGKHFGGKCLPEL